MNGKCQKCGLVYAKGWHTHGDTVCLRRQLATVRERLQRYESLDAALPEGCDLSDTATAELAVELTAARQRIADLEADLEEERSRVAREPWPTCPVCNRTAKR